MIFRILTRSGKRIIPYTRGKYKEINIITLKEEYKDKYTIYLRILEKINSYRIIAIIDSGVTGNFIVENTTQAIELLRRKKVEPFTIRLINELVTKKEISKKITLLPIAI